jgi:hypothetical protein
MHEAVVELIIENFNSTGVLMDVQEAAKQVEEHLVNEGLKFAQLGKVQSRLKPPVAAEPPKQQAPAPKQQAVTVQPKTLSNSMPTAPSKKTAERERIARAIAAFKGELK